MGNNCQQLFKFRSSETASADAQIKGEAEAKSSSGGDEQPSSSPSSLAIEPEEPFSLGKEPETDTAGSESGSSGSETESRYLDRRFSEFDLIRETPVEGPNKSDLKVAKQPRSDNIKKFLDQDIEKIRKQKSAFKDPKFPANIKAINRKPPGKIE